MPKVRFLTFFRVLQRVTMKFDDFLKIIGEFGPYQRRTYCLILLPVLLTGMQMMAPVFILDVPSHRFVSGQRGNGALML